MKGSRPSSVRIVHAVVLAPSHARVVRCARTCSRATSRSNVGPLSTRSPPVPFAVVAIRNDAGAARSLSIATMARLARPARRDRSLYAERNVGRDRWHRGWTDALVEVHGRDHSSDWRYPVEPVGAPHRADDGWPEAASGVERATGERPGHEGSSEHRGAKRERSYAGGRPWIRGHAHDHEREQRGVHEFHTERSA